MGSLLRRITESPKRESPKREGQAGFLPDFCQVGAVVIVVISAQLLAMVLALYAASDSRDAIEVFSRTSWFILWVALASALLLCLLRPLWRRLTPLAAGLLAWLLIVLVTFVVSVSAAQLLGSLWSALQQQSFYLKSVGISAIVGALVLRYLYIQHRWREQVEAEAEARLQAMQARIRPHFLFNSMNTLAELTRSDPLRAEQVVEDLSDLYRACMLEYHKGNTLGDELELVRGYLRIEALRLGERLTVRWTLEQLPLTACLPALVLQPLVENAVYHGVEPSEEGGWLELGGRCSGGRIHLSIRNSLPPAGGRVRPGNQLALTNIRIRLHAFFGPSARLQSTEQEGIYQVELHFPIQP